MPLSDLPALSLFVILGRSGPFHTASKLSLNGDGGAGFYRFPAWAEVKPNDVSPGHAISAKTGNRTPLGPDYSSNPLRTVTR